MYDTAIIGGGPAGLTAAIYLQRYGLKSIVFSDKLGGLIIENPFIENYPGFKSIDGAELGLRMKEQAESLGAVVQMGKIVSIGREGKAFAVKTEWGDEVKARTVILAQGLRRKKLGARNEEKFLGKGVSYCTTCDGPFFKNKTAVVVGGGDSAGVAALLLEKFAGKIYIVHRRDEFRMQDAYLKLLKGSKKISILLNETVAECAGEKRLEKVVLSSGKEIRTDGLFVEIGFEPPEAMKMNFKVDTTENGFIKVKEDMSTGIPGVFAAGDITTGSNNLHQIVTAASEGAIAADSVRMHCLKTVHEP
jgi:thioredoxin reductase (NADPH)